VCRVEDMRRLRVLRVEKGKVSQPGVREDTPVDAADRKRSHGTRRALFKGTSRTAREIDDLGCSGRCSSQARWVHRSAGAKVWARWGLYGQSRVVALLDKCCRASVGRRASARVLLGGDSNLEATSGKTKSALEFSRARCR